MVVRPSDGIDQPSLMMIDQNKGDKMSKTNIPLKMVGEDGNAFSILGRAKRAMRMADQVELFDEYHAEATSGDYDHLLVTTMNWFDVDIDGDDGDEY